MPMTANGIGRSERGERRPSTHASASPASSRDVTASGASPTRSRAPIRSSSRRLKRRSPARAGSTGSGRHCNVARADVAQLRRLPLPDEPVVVAEQVHDVGLAEQLVADHVGSIRAPGRPAPRSRLLAERRRQRPRRGSAPRSGGGAGAARGRGSGVADSQSRTTGSRAWSTRDVRVSPCGELPQRGPGVLGVGEPERGQPVSTALGGNAPHAGERVEDRARRTAARAGPAPRPDARGGRLERLRAPVTRGAVPVAEHPGEQRPASLVGRAACASAPRRAAAAGARPRAGTCRRRRAARRRRRSTYPPLASSAERVQRRRGAERRVLAAVDQLEELHSELDVADPAPSPLELAAGDAPSPLLRLAARLHRPGAAHGVRVQHVGPHERSGLVDKRRPEVLVAGDRAGLDAAPGTPTVWAHRSYQAW